MAVFFALICFFPLEAVSAHHNVQWEGTQVMVGQIGKLEVLKKTNIYKIKNKKLTFYKKAKVRSIHRVYTIDEKKKLYNIGSGEYMKVNSKVLSYKEIPQNVLDKMKVKHTYLFRGMYIGDTLNQVKKKEKSKFLIGDQDILIYNAKRYGYDVDLIYSFKKKKLNSGWYDIQFKNKYYPNNKLKGIHDQIKKEIIKKEKLQDKGFSFSNGPSGYYTSWKLKNRTIYLSVSNKKTKTEAYVMFYLE